MALPPLKTEDSAGNTVNAATLQLKFPYGTAKKSGIETELFNPALKNRLTAPGDAKLGSITGITSGSYAINVIDDDATDSFATQSAGVEPEVGMAIKLISTGASTAPTNFTYGTTYYVRSTNPITLSDTPGGALRAITGAGVGQHIMIPVERPFNVTGTRPAATNVTVAVNTSSPITGAADFTVTGSSSRIGDYVAWPFTIDQSERGTVLTAKFKYSIVLADNEGFSVWVRDITNNQLIAVTPEKLFYSQTLSAQFQGSFQTSSNSTSYELILFKRVAGANLWSSTININEIEVGPQSIARGPMISDPVDWTPTGTWVTNATYNGKKWREGAIGHYLVRVLLSGAPTSTALAINMPSGEVIDTTKFPATPTTIVTKFPDSKVTVVDVSDSNRNHAGETLYRNTTSVHVIYDRTFNGNQYIVNDSGVTQAAPFTMASGDFIEIYWSAPILGWSSSQVLSSDDSGRRIFANAYVTANTAISTTAFVASTVDQNIGGAYNSATGLFTCPEPGLYRVGLTGFFDSGGTTRYYFAVKNGTKVGESLAQSVGATTIAYGSKVVPCNAGDTLAVGCSASATMAYSAGNYRPEISFEKVNIGNQQIAASETVACAVYLSANATTSTTLPIPFDTKDQDTHGAFTTGSTGRFTAPISGSYLVTGYGDFSGAAACYIYKNGTQFKIVGYDNSTMNNTFNTVIQLLAGEYFDIRAGTSVTVLGGARNAASNIHVVRIGNY